MGSEDIFHKRKGREGAALGRNRPIREPNKRYLIVCEGTKTEPIYFRDLLADLRVRPQLVRIAPNDGVTPDKVVKHALGLYEEDKTAGDAFDAVYCVFDRDSHSTFDAAVQQIKGSCAKGKPLVAITSTPCFEVWLLQHFSYSSKPYHAAGKKSVGDKVVADLKTRPGLSQYNKGQSNIYGLLKANLQTALANAEQLRKHNEASGSSNPSTDIDRLVLDIQKLLR